MDYKVMLDSLGKKLDTPVENWKAVNNHYFELEKTHGVKQPYQFVLDMLSHKKNLFFVDIGAHDGLSCSNSAYMEFFLNWTGICIEPHSELFELLDESRNCKLYNCCINDSEGDVDFVSVSGDADALSGIYENMTKEHLDRIKGHIKKHGGDYKIEKIKSLSLNSILEENSVTNIDYLSIDTEGSELNILKGIDYNKYNIDIISAENNNDSDMSVRLFLESKGYIFITKCCADEIYKKNK